MITVNSLSGGKTSSDLAKHYPADHNVFSLIRIEDKRCTPNEFLVKKIEDKIQMKFIASTEVDRTLYMMFDLEQELGKEIKWVTGETFESLIKRKKYLPNQQTRFCTTELKVKPIFDWWQKEINEIVEMRCGYRYDESERQDTFTTSFKTIVGKSKKGNRNKWAEIEWRVGKFPMIEDRVNNWHIIKYWRDKYYGVKLDDFPPDSNCVGCFWKHPLQLRKNWEDNPDHMRWFAEQETKKRRWQKDGMYDDYAKLNMQSEFHFGDGIGCKSGECAP